MIGIQWYYLNYAKQALYQRGNLSHSYLFLLFHLVLWFESLFPLPLEERAKNELKVTKHAFVWYNAAFLSLTNSEE